VHLLAVEFVVDVAAAGEQFCREHRIHRLGFLEAQQVRLLVVEEARDDPGPGADRIDVPAGDLEGGQGTLFGLGFASALAGDALLAKKRPLLRGHGARADQAFVTQGGSGDPG